MIRPSEKIPVIYYHSIGPIVPNWNRHYLTLEARFFEGQLRYFSKHFDLIDLKSYYEIRTGKKDGPKSPLVVTIDDGYLDNWIWAYPLLKKYKVPATIFVSPEFVDPRPVIRPNLEDFWNGSTDEKSLSETGFLSWDEMRLMEASGLIDIQSHTMTHTKYFVSDQISDFHHPGGDALYPIGNIFPMEKPFHIANNDFEQLIPYGTPLFKEKSSVVAKKVKINPDFSKCCLTALKGYNFHNYKFPEVFSIVKPILKEFRAANNLILSEETEEAYEERLRYEIITSKTIIENHLSKNVEFLCWPHGDNNEKAHRIAIEAGYLATTLGNLQQFSMTPDRIPARFGVSPFLKSPQLGIAKARAKIDLFRGKGYAKVIEKAYRLAKLM